MASVSKRVTRFMKEQARRNLQPTSEPDVTEKPTPIYISKLARTLLFLVVLALLIVVIWQVPTVLTTAVGGFAFALVMSFPVGFLSRFMRRSLAILASFLIIVGLVVIAALVVFPLIGQQVASLVQNAPMVANNAEQYLNDILNFLRERGILTGDPDDIAQRIREDLMSAARSVAGSVVGGAFNVLSGTFSFGLTLFGVAFIGVYLLADVRRFKAAFLRAAPHDYRRDVQTLWESFGYSLSRYLSGLALVLVIQGTLSATALWIIGVPYALALGAWVSFSAIIPYLGAWLGAVPAVIVASTTDRPLTNVALVAALFFAIQQLEGNFLTPRIQGDALKVHPVVVFLAVITGGGLGGLLGVLFAVPTLAVCRVLFDFFRVRLTTSSDSVDNLEELSMKKESASSG